VSVNLGPFLLVVDGKCQPPEQETLLPHSKGDWIFLFRPLLLRYIFRLDGSLDWGLEPLAPSVESGFPHGADMHTSVKSEIPGF
jgi:hypothetical protein